MSGHAGGKFFPLKPNLFNILCEISGTRCKKTQFDLIADLIYGRIERNPNKQMIFKKEAQIQLIFCVLALPKRKQILLTEEYDSCRKCIQETLKNQWH